MNWYKINKFSATDIQQLANQIYYMLINAANEEVSIPGYGGVEDPLSLKEAINIATNKVLRVTGQSSLNEQQMNIVRRIDPDFIGNNVQENIGDENVQQNIIENGQEPTELIPQI